MGKNYIKDSFLIRDQFDITDIEQVRNRSKALTLNTIKVLVNTILENQVSRVLTIQQDIQGKKCLNLTVLENYLLLK